MKLKQQNIIQLLLLLILVFHFGKLGANNHKGFTTTRSITVHTFEEDEEENSSQFHKKSIGEASQTISQNENFGVGYLGIFHSRHLQFETPHEELFNSEYHLKDKRAFIFQYLYPFHFFW